MATRGLRTGPDTAAPMPWLKRYPDDVDWRMPLNVAPLYTLLDEAVARGRDLGGDRPVQISVQTAPGIPLIRADRVRLPRAVATLVAYAVREAAGPSLRIVAAPEAPGLARIDVEVPNERVKARELESVLDPGHAPGLTEHRGLSLALRLGRAIVELHGGTVTLDRRAGTETFSLHVPTAGLSG